MEILHLKLNSVTVKSSYPLPVIEDIFTSLNSLNTKIIFMFGFEKWVLANKVKEEDKHKTAFVCYEGLYEIWSD